MNNNVNPNENLNQNNNLAQGSTNNVPTDVNNNPGQSNNVVENVAVNNNPGVVQSVSGKNASVNTDVGVSNDTTVPVSIASTTTTDANTEQIENTDNVKKVDERFSLFKQKDDKKTTPVIMSKKMSDKLEAERRKQREENEKYEAKPVSKVKYALMIIFFIFMFALVFFLPDITNYINIKKDLKAQENAPAITTGLLTCRLDRTTDIFNISYTAQFSFTDSKLNKLSYVTSTEGDAIVDSDQLDAVLSKCKLLQNEVDSLAGVRVSCNQSEGTVVETQDFTYSLINKESINSAYIEAGGVYPEFENEQNIDVIEKNMSASGYKCERSAS